jgi:hypothetical protein
MLHHLGEQEIVVQIDHLAVIVLLVER